MTTLEDVCQTPVLEERMSQKQHENIKFSLPEQRKQYFFKHRKGKTSNMFNENFLYYDIYSN
jgi:hypothetical protein